MKPQCNTSAECLRELARVMEQFWIADIFAALRSKYCKWSGGEILNAIAALEAVEKHPDLLTCAIAEVEGKPVFIGDELYSTNTGRKFQVHSTRVSNGVLILRECYADGHNEFATEQCAWTPPHPATVMVELPVEDAEILKNWILSPPVSAKVAEACNKALEQIK